MFCGHKSIRSAISILRGPWSMVVNLHIPFLLYQISLIIVTTLCRNFYMINMNIVCIVICIWKGFRPKTCFIYVAVKLMSPIEKQRQKEVYDAWLGWICKSSMINPFSESMCPIYIYEAGLYKQPFTLATRKVINWRKTATSCRHLRYCR